MRTRFTGRAGVLAVAVALLAACGSSGSGGSSKATTADAGAPQTGGSLAVVAQAEPRALDPGGLINNTSSQTLVGNALYGHLMVVNDKGQVDYGQAKDLSTSDGGTTWTLTLRDGLTFSDGTPLDAAAVQFAWARLKDPAIGGTNAATAKLIGTMTPSGQTLKFTLTTPIAQFADVIAAASLNWIASPQALQAGPAAFDAAPIGAGPFVLKSWQRGGQMVLDRNKKYWDPKRPYLDELVITANPDADQRFSALESGGAGAATSSNPSLANRAADEGMTVLTQNLGGGLILDMNTRMAPFDDVRARQAIGLAIDRAALNEVAYGGSAKVPDTLFPDHSPYNGDATFPKHDPAAAQKLFDALAAEGKPVHFLLTTYNATETKRIAEAAQAELNQFHNVKVDVEVLDFGAGVAKFSARSWQMIVGAINFPTGVALRGSYYSSSAGNPSGISDPQMDAALDKALAATDNDARAKEYQVVAKRFSELLPSLIYVRQPYAFVESKKVHGAQLYGTGAVRVDSMWMSH